MFSPWYAWSGRKTPQNHVCLNVATYGPGGRFTMTDRGTSALRQEKDTLTLGPSRMHWTGRELVIGVRDTGPGIAPHVQEVVFERDRKSVV